MTSIVFRSHLKFLMNYRKSTRILKEVRVFVWRVEDQQKGFPYVHIIFWTDSDTPDIHEMYKLINVRCPESSSIHDE
jgi:hypothetical protein